MGQRFKEIPETSARPDNRGRITLGSHLTAGVSRYDVFVDEVSGEVLLKPYKEIPIKEAWLYENEVSHNLVVQGLNSAQAGKFVEIDLEKSSWIDEIEDDE